MKKDVIITIKSQQNMNGQDQDTVELVTTGRLTSHGPDGYLLSYQETELTGMGNTRSTFRVDPNRVSLIRTGQVCSQMVFEMGRKHTSVYGTPFGNLEIGITARRIDAELNDDGGHLNIDYAIDVDHLITGSYQFRIDVREAGVSAAAQPNRRGSLRRTDRAADAERKNDECGV
ncbi:MAG: DUF1934 domain-containing protein [Oscillospiraceae bacterium]|nr:DUF1934 domain-containing protein [Oscillospiraceae bacterium]